MRPGKLYIKIFLSFLLVLIITEILIFGVFVVAAGRTFRTRFEQYTVAKVLLLKEVVEDKIKSERNRPLAQNESLMSFLKRFEEFVGAKVWLAGPDNIPILKSFTGDVPNNLENFSEKHMKDFGQFKLYYSHKRHFEIYATIPIEIRAGEIGNLHILFLKKGPPHPEGRFVLGLAVIGIVIALLVIPVARLITEPLKRLRHSALKIAEGDLSHRATVKSKDEIGELGRSFNHMANKLERMIRGGRELTANVSHELRSPLARIRVAEELLRERLEQDDYHDGDRHLDDIGEDIDELDRLIGSILDLSKLDIHEDVFRIERLNLSELINGLLDRLKPAIERRHLDISTDLPSDQHFLGDEDALGTALSNILENAVKFTPEKGHIIVNMQSKEDALAISVTNTFEPLPEDDLAQMFEPFYRTERTPASGSGLGLAITKKIIEGHGGSIQALNSPEGLTIQIGLPSPSPEKEV